MAAPRSRFDLRVLVLVPGAARWAGAQESFDLTSLDVLRERMVEVEQIGSQASAGDGGTSLHLSALARYLVENGFDFAFGTVAVSLADGGHAAASLHRSMSETSMSPEDLRVHPRRRLPLETLVDTLPARPPQLLRAYLERGAWLCGEPAADTQRGHAKVPMLLALARMRGRYARRFLARAA